MTGMSIARLPDNARPGWLIAFRADRLGARLVSLMNAMRIAEDMDAGFACAWTDSTGVGHVFNDPSELFDSDFVDQHFLDADTWRVHRRTCDALSGQLQQDADGVASALSDGTDLIVGNAFGVICLGGETKAEITPNFRAQFDRIPFAAPVRNAMSALSDALSGHTAYHIRRGDLTGDLKAMNKAWPHKVVPNEFYERHMERALGTSGGVILFSDNTEMIDHYRATFAGLKTLPDLIDIDALTEAQRDFLELYAMSRCATIIAPERSAFSSTAADLTGAVKQSVMDALTEADREAAYQALYRRLLERPESFPGEGEIGQCLAHVGDWLENAERWRDAADLFAKRVEGGLNISFVYPRTMTYLHRANDPAGVVRTATQMQSRSIVHVKDQAAAELLHGYGHWRLGDRAAATRHIANGFWHAPSIPAAKSVVPFLIVTGHLTPRNFLPASRLQLSLLTRRGPLKSLFVDFPDLIDTAEGAKLPVALGAMEPVLWDWAPLMRSISITAEVRRGTIARFTEALTGAPDDPRHRSERESLLAIFSAFGGETDAGAARLEELMAEFAEAPMVHQRLSHAHWLARRFRKAALAADRAAGLRPNWLALRTWAGQTALRIREYDRAREHLEAAATVDAGLASVHALLAECCDRQGDPKALSEAERAIDLAPLEVEHVLRIARLLEKADRPDEAIEHMMPVIAAQRAPAKLFVQAINLLEKMGLTSDAGDMIAEAHARIPGHPALEKLSEDRTTQLVP